MIHYEPVIGLEVHVQLRTRSKMFCACPASYQQAAPNSLVCPVCLGLPGALPVINRQATEAVILTGLALNSTIAEDSKFDRKNYPYPDLMKGYQISQFDLPLCTGGYLELGSGEEQRWVRIRRVHLEEDVAKLWTEDKSPPLTTKVPKIERQKVVIINSIFHFFSMTLRSCTTIECKKAVPTSQGRSATFSTGSHPQ